MLRRVGTRIALSVGVVASAAALAGLSTWASFTDSTNATHAISTGSVDLDLGAPGTGDNRLDVAVGSIAPGDVIDRALTLHNSSDIALQQVTLTTTASPSSVLDADPVDGLRVSIQRCAVPWTEVELVDGYTYSCTPGATTVLAQRAIVMTNQVLGGVTLTAGGGSNYLRVRTILPSSAGNDFQGQSSSLGYTFTGVQRSATNR